MDLVSKWYDIGNDFDLAYTVFEENRDALLRLIPPERFLIAFATENLGADRSGKKLLKALSQKSAAYRRPHYFRFMLRRLRQKLIVLAGRY